MQFVDELVNFGDELGNVLIHLSNSVRILLNLYPIRTAVQIQAVKGVSQNADAQQQEAGKA